MTAPICPMLTAGTLAGGEWPHPKAAEIPCQGSACALWVPEIRGEHNLPSKETKRFLRIQPGGYDHPTGNGWCANNLRREPYPDPATKGDPR